MNVLQKCYERKIYRMLGGLVALFITVFSVGFTAFAEERYENDYSAENGAYDDVSEGIFVNEEVIIPDSEANQITQYLVVADSPITVEVAPYEDFPVLRSYSGSVYNGTISTTYLDFFEGIILNEMPVNYVCFRQTQYVYALYYGDNLELSGSTFRGSGLKSVTYNSQTGNGTVSRGTNETLNVNASNGFVYSNLGGYSSFDTVKQVTYQRTEILAITVLIAFSFLRIILFHR